MRKRATSASTYASECTRGRSSITATTSWGSRSAARVTAHAGPGEVVVSRTVADLVAGSGLEFEDRGTHELKGVPGEWQLFEVVG